MTIIESKKLAMKWAKENGYVFPSYDGFDDTSQRILDAVIDAFMAGLEAATSDEEE